MASGNTLCVFLPQSHMPPATSGPVFNLRNAQLVLEFANGSNLSALFRFILPRNYSGNGLTITIYWVTKTSTAGTALWGASIERNNPGSSITGDNFGAEVTQATGAPGTSGLVASTSINLPNGVGISNLQAGEAYRLKVRRLTNGVSDISDPCQVIAIEIKET